MTRAWAEFLLVSKFSKSGDEPILVEVERDICHLRVIVHDDVTQKIVADYFLLPELTDKINGGNRFVDSKLFFEVATECRMILLIIYSYAAMQSMQVR